MTVTAYSPKNPRRPRPVFTTEKDWVPMVEEFGHRALRHAFIGCGLPAQTAGGLVWFLDDQRNLDRHQSEKSRNRYRQMLSQLDLQKVRALATRHTGGLFNSQAA